MTQHKSTFCRICEPACSIKARFDDDGSLVGLEPDRDHPAGGFACHKGLSYLDVHRDPDRLNWPQRRLNSKTELKGEFVDTSWDEAIEEIAARIGRLREQYGPDSVAVYMGNPFVFNAAAASYIGQFQDALQTHMRFHAGTQDSLSKVTAVTEVYGSPDALLIPDIYHTDYLLCLGANPKVSRWSFISTPNDWDVVKDINRRGGKVRFVNPRRIESSSAETGPTLLIRPATDVYFLAAILNEIEIRRGFGDDLVSRYAKNVDGLRNFVSRYPAETVATITGIAAETIKDIATELLAAPSAIVYMSTGLHQSRQGVLCTWLVEMLNLVTGNLGQVGGLVKTSGLFDHYAPKVGTKTVQTSLGDFTMSDPIGYSAIPGVVLADLIESGDIRAMIVVGGNPLLTVGGGDKLRRAFEKLDTVVSVDIYRGVTGEMSDFVLPAVDWLERPDINLLGCGMQSIPFVKYTDAMVEPKAGRRNDWWILARLVQALGLPSPLDDPQASIPGVIGGLLSARDLSIEQMVEAPHQSVALPEIAEGTFFDRCLLHEDGKIDCCPAVFATSGLFSRCDDIFAELSSEPPNALKMISLRTPYMQNSWLSNSETFRIGTNAENPLHMCDADASILGLFAGDRVSVSNASGCIETRIVIDDDLAVGTVAMTHGFGQQHAYALATAQLHPGANCNALLPTGPESFEPLSYMSWVTGVPVTVKSITTSADQVGAG